MLDLAPAVAAVRSFNRAYTKVIGLLDEGLVKSPYTLTEVRVLFEIAHAAPDGASVARIREDLGLAEMTLTPGSDGSFTGTGKDDGGVVYKLKVTQRPGQIVLDHESPARTAPGKVTTGQVKFGK